LGAAKVDFREALIEFPNEERGVFGANPERDDRAGIPQNGMTYIRVHWTRY